MAVTTTLASTVLGHEIRSAVIRFRRVESVVPGTRHSPGSEGSPGLSLRVQTTSFARIMGPVDVSVQKISPANLHFLNTSEALFLTSIVRIKKPLISLVGSLF